MYVWLVRRVSTCTIATCHTGLSNIPSYSSLTSLPRELQNWVDFQACRAVLQSVRPRDLTSAPPHVVSFSSAGRLAARSSHRYLSSREAEQPWQRDSVASTEVFDTMSNLSRLCPTALRFLPGFLTRSPDFVSRIACLVMLAPHAAFLLSGRLLAKAHSMRR